MVAFLGFGAVAMIDWRRRREGTASRGRRFGGECLVMQCRRLPSGLDGGFCAAHGGAFGVEVRVFERVKDYLAGVEC